MNSTYEAVCYLGRSIANGDYMVLPFRRDPEIGTYVLVNGFEEIDSERLVEKGADSITSVLEKSEYRDPVCFADAAVKKQMLTLKRKCLFIQIELLVRNDLKQVKIIPLQGQRGWRFEPMNRGTILSLPTKKCEFLEAVEKAFELAC